jgi:hypothetical protein
VFGAFVIFAGNAGGTLRHAKGKTMWQKVFVLFAILAVLSSASTALSRGGGHGGSHGNVRPCSLDGVNPAYHKNIFGNPAIAAREYGFVQLRDGSWQVTANCHTS